MMTAAIWTQCPKCTVQVRKMFSLMMINEPEIQSSEFQFHNLDKTNENTKKGLNSKYNWMSSKQNPNLRYSSNKINKMNSKNTKSDQAAETINHQLIVPATNKEVKHKLQNEEDESKLRKIWNTKLPLQANSSTTHFSSAILM